MTGGDWLDIDVLGNALDNLEKTVMFLSNSKDSYRWKWATTALTNALYGFMICALSPDGEFPVIDWNGSEEDRRKKAEIDALGKTGSIEALRERGRIITEHLRSPRVKLIRFNEALKRIRTERWMGSSDSVIDKPIELSDKQCNSIRDLRREYRDYFEHCVGPHWSIHGGEFVGPFRETNDAICKVLTDIRMCWGRQNECDRANLLVKKINSLLDKTEQQLKSS